jgi:hypothetical protein
MARARGSGAGARVSDAAGSARQCVPDGILVPRRRRIAQPFRPGLAHDWLAHSARAAAARWRLRRMVSARRARRRRWRRESAQLT